MSKLNNKVAVITGGSSGIGLATAQRFIEEGAQVVITGRHQKELDTAVAKLGDRAAIVRSSLLRPEHWVMRAGLRQCREISAIWRPERRWSTLRLNDSAKSMCS